MALIHRKDNRIILCNPLSIRGHYISPEELLFWGHVTEMIIKIEAVATGEKEAVPKFVRPPVGAGK